jgi:ribosome-associated protein
VKIAQIRPGSPKISMDDQGSRRDVIPVSPSISIRDDEVSFEFIRSSGPGGQNVNKVATAVRLRFDVLHSPSISDEVRLRVLASARKRITDQGVLHIEARRFRTQERNRQDAIERLKTLLRAAEERPRIRRPTKPSAAARSRRLEEKRRRSGVKRARRSTADDLD